MKMDEYQSLAARTATASGAVEFDTVILALGVAGEAGEVADIVKKAYGHGHGLDVNDLAAELGDVLWYVATLAGLHDVSLSDIAEKNIEKLRRRYPDGFSRDASVNRADDE